VKIGPHHYGVKTPLSAVLSDGVLKNHDDFNTFRTPGRYTIPAGVAHNTRNQPYAFKGECYLYVIKNTVHGADYILQHMLGVKGRKVALYHRVYDHSRKRWGNWKTWL